MVTIANVDTSLIALEAAKAAKYPNYRATKSQKLSEWKAEKRQIINKIKAVIATREKQPLIDTRYPKIPLDRK